MRPTKWRTGKVRPIQTKQTGYPDKFLGRRNLRSPGLKHLVGSGSPPQPPILPQPDLTIHCLLYVYESNGLTRALIHSNVR